MKNKSLVIVVIVVLLLLVGVVYWERTSDDGNDGNGVGVGNTGNELNNGTGADSLIQEDQNNEEDDEATGTGVPLGEGYEGIDISYYNLEKVDEVLLGYKDSGFEENTNFLRFLCNNNEYIEEYYNRRYNEVPGEKDGELNNFLDSGETCYTTLLDGFLDKSILDNNGTTRNYLYENCKIDKAGIEADGGYFGGNFEPTILVMTAYYTGYVDKTITSEYLKKFADIEPSDYEYYGMNESKYAELYYNVLNNKKYTSQECDVLAE